MDNHTPGSTTPSKLALRSACPASGGMEASTAYYDGPEKESEYAERGRELHKLAAQALAAHWPNPLSEFVVHAECPDELEFYIEFLKELAFENSEPYKYWFEASMEIFEGFFGIVDFGMTDYEKPGSAEKKAKVVDLKTGYISVLGAAKNPQGMAYALGTHRRVGAMEVEVIFIQPNCFPKVSRATFDFSEGQADEYERILRGIVAKTKEWDAPRRSGKHCDAHFCTAQKHCPAYGNMHRTEIENIQRYSTPEALASSVVTWTLEQLSEARNQIKQADEAVNALKPLVDKEIERRALEDGKETPGWAVLPKFKNREVVDETALADMLSRENLWTCWTDTGKITHSLAQMEKNASKVLRARAKERGEKLTDYEAKKLLAELWQDFVEHKQNGYKVEYRPEPEKQWLEEYKESVSEETYSDRFIGQDPGATKQLEEDNEYDLRPDDESFSDGDGHVVEFLADAVESDTGRWIDPDMEDQ